MDEGRLEQLKSLVSGLVAGQEGIVSVVLIGSFSRGEELCVEQDGAKKYLSDVEFMLVLGEEQMADGKGKEEIASKIKGAVQSVIAQVEVSVGFTTRWHLARLKPHIFTLELKRFGKVLCGDDKVLELIPDYDENNLSRFDALVLLNNRIVEQTKLYLRIMREDSVNQYDIDKGYIQVANSILAFEKRYRCQYPEKERELMAWAKEEDSPVEGLALNLPAFQEAFRNIFEKQFSDLSRDAALNQWLGLRSEFEKVLRFEISEILDYETVEPEQAVQFLLSIPDLVSCIKGWIKIASNGQLSCFSSKELLVHIWHTSPNFLIYHKAATQYFAQEPDMESIDRIVGLWEKITK